MTGYAVVLGTGVVALGTIKCYARAGLRAIHLTTKDDDLASGSRYAYKSYRVPAPDSDPAGLLNMLTRVLPEWPDAVLDPVNDPGVVFVAQHHAALSQRYHLSVPPWQLLQGIVDKGSLYQRAHAIGVPAPKIIKYGTPADLAREAAGVAYPCIIKPTQTPEFFAIYNQKALVADNAATLVRLYREVRDRGLDVMVSEIIPGPETLLTAYVCHLDDRQNVLAELCVQKIRQHPADFGYGIVKKTIPMIGEIRDLALRMLRDAKYSGFSTTEFKWDTRDEQHKLIEINTRQVSYAHLFAGATINFPEIMYRDKIERQTVFRTDYRPDVYWIQPMDDLYEYRSRRADPGFSAREFFRPYFTRHKVFALGPFDDARPFFNAVGKLWPVFVQKVRHKLLTPKPAT